MEEEIEKYICLVLGTARDYNYLVNENKNIIDSEVTSLYPLSYTQISFILYLLSLKDPYIYHIFLFKKDRKEGIRSDRLYRALTRDKEITTTRMFADKKFQYLKMPPKMYLSDVVVTDNIQENNNWHTLFLKNDTRMLRYPNIIAKKKFTTMLYLESIFKEDVLFYLPVFHYNFYNDYIILSKTDRDKFNFKVELTDEGRARLLLKKRWFYSKLYNDYKEKKVTLKYRVKKQEQNIDVLHEFFLKSILIRRNPFRLLNTVKNRTDGYYILKRGVSVFREMIINDMLKNEKVYDDSLLDITSTNIRINGKLTPNKQVYDFKNKSSLINKKIEKLIDNKDLYTLIKYIQLYTRLVPDDKTCYYILANYLKDHTCFSGKIQKDKNKRTFRKYEGLRESSIRKLATRFSSTYFQS